MNKLQQIKTKSLIVADTGDIDQIKKYRPEDATTNPTLVLKALENEKYKFFLEAVVQQLKNLNASLAQKVNMGCDHLAVTIGKEILLNIDGYVSTEVDSRLSFDVEKTVNRGKQLVKYYETIGIPKDRVLIKIAATWEGIKAAEILKMEGIKCNMTLIFDIHQAIAVANSDLFMISPFVGRILDWYNKNEPKDYTAANDPGVLSVKQIYNYYKKFDVKTIVMAASFRNQQQVEALTGCDRLTIAPNLLDSLENDNEKINTSITDFDAKDQYESKVFLSASDFRWQLNESAMATEKLAEGIRKFAEDQVKLEKMLLAELSK